MLMLAYLIEPVHTPENNIHEEFRAAFKSIFQQAKKINKNKNYAHSTHSSA